MEKRYTNGELTVIWKPEVCIHSATCWEGLGEVFNPQKRPWVNMQGASTERIIKQVEQCPSGALSYLLDSKTEPAAQPKEVKVEVTPNGPLVVHGNICIKDKDGSETIRSARTAFCRCGSSGNKPYCDGSHFTVDFKG